MSMQNYYFNEQLAKYIVQFMAVFQGLTYTTGKREDGLIRQFPVPVIYGSKDRVTASILSDNTQNQAIRLPTMSAYMSQIRVAPERRKGVGVERRNVFLPKGGLLPNDIKTVYQLMPVPYDVSMELSIYTSNMNQQRQIVEQILMYFDPLVQIQKSDDDFDWTKITQVELVDINFDENYPAGADQRAIISTLTFEMPIYISAPSDLKTQWVKEIMIRLVAVDTDESFQEVLESLDGYSNPITIVTSVSDMPSVQIGTACETNEDEIITPEEGC